MAIDITLFDKEIPIDSILLKLENGTSVPVDILRLDKIHTTISGNKWFKLKYNLLEAEKLNATIIISFGGAYSNHLHALAFAGYIFNIKTIGIVRGEEVDNSTLKDCKNWGMELHFVSRSDYRKKTSTDFYNNLNKQFPNSYIIPEGGDNELGQKGCTEILMDSMQEKYNILCCSIGTGTTIKGLSQTFNNEIWGFAPFKNAHSLRQKLAAQISNLEYIDQFHFGGFGKVTNDLLAFQTDFFENFSIELDKIYTAKMFYGIQHKLIEQPEHQNKKIVAVHTGGLQGNRSGI